MACSSVIPLSTQPLYIFSASTFPLPEGDCPVLDSFCATPLELPELVLKAISLNSCCVAISILYQGSQKVLLSGPLGLIPSIRLARPSFCCSMNSSSFVLQHLRIVIMVPIIIRFDITLVLAIVQISCVFLRLLSQRILELMTYHSHISMIILVSFCSSRLHVGILLPPNVGGMTVTCSLIQSCVPSLLHSWNLVLLMRLAATPPR